MGSCRKILPSGNSSLETAVAAVLANIFGAEAATFPKGKCHRHFKVFT